jgi:RimJ/RimL family protein N-acetyltransferase
MPLDIPPLSGRWIRLEPLADEHREALRIAADDESIWAVNISAGHGPHFDAWFAEALSERDAGRRIPFAVRRLADDQIVGSTSFLDIQPRHKRIEIGATWYVPAAWSTAVNPECKLLLLEHAFDVLRLNRVALVTDKLNTRSQAAIAKLGATREGVLHWHMIAQAGRVRDSVLFSIIAPAWPRVRDGLLARLVAFEKTK